MKKSVIFLVIISLFVVSFFGKVDAAANGSSKTPSLTMQVLGTSINKSVPIQEKGILYLPLRDLSEAMGYKVEYNAKDNAIELINSIRRTKLYIKTSSLEINGKSIKLGNPLYIKNDITYIPESSVYTVFGSSVEYNKNTNEVKVGCLRELSENENPQNQKGIFLKDKKADPEFYPIIEAGQVMIPLRPIGEGLDYLVNWDYQTQTMIIEKEEQKITFVINKDKAIINGKEIAMDKKTILLNGRAYVPLSFLEKNLKYNFQYNKEFNNLIVKEGEQKKVISKIQDIVYTEESGFPQLEIISDTPLDYKTLVLDNPCRMVIDLEDSIVDTEFESKDIEKGNIIRVRIGQLSIEPNITRVVVDLKDHKKAKVVQSGDKQSISIVYANIVQPIKVSKEGSKDVITIQGSESIDSSLFKLENPDRLVVDIKRAVLEGKEQNITINDSKTVKSVRTGQFEIGTARIVLDVDETVFYDIRTQGDTTKIYLSSAPFDFMDYDKFYNSAYVNINPEKTKDYSINFDRNKRILKVEIKKELEYEKDYFEIDDNLVDYIKVNKEKHDGKTSTIAELKLKDNIEYEVISPDLGDLISLRLVHVPIEPKDVLIIVDAGHGGKDPGAIALDKTPEKTFNIDVAERLNKKLQDLGFETIMVRDEDVYVSLQDRASLANKNYADFFMSIHFNAFMEKTQGIETLYYPNLITDEYNVNNRDIAGIFQEELIDTLKRPSRGVVPRPNLYVLNKTNMPAILAELGFITNKEELSLIKKDEYRDKAANALAVSIVRYYKEIRGIDFEIDIAAIYANEIPTEKNREMAKEQ